MLKIAFLLIFYFTLNSILFQKIDNKVSFTVKFDLTNETKSYGYYLEHYFVNINPKKALKLNGKIIKVTGKYKIIRRLIKKYNSKGEQIHSQGIQNDIKYIQFPKIVIIKE